VIDGELYLSDLERAVTRDVGTSGYDVGLIFYRHLLLETEQMQKKSKRVADNRR
jgi:hypothetical protein